MEDQQVVVDLELLQDYEFKVKFREGLEDLIMDEPEPLGRGQGPNASRILAAAVGNCLSASLLLCLRKAKLSPAGLKTSVTTRLTRNEGGRLRIGESRVSIQLDLDPALHGKLGRCMELFENYCVVTQSVRAGIPVEVVVTSPAGEVFHRSNALKTPAV